MREIRYSNNCLVCNKKIYYDLESLLKHSDCKFKLKDALRIYLKLFLFKTMLLLTNVEHTHNSFMDMVYFSELKNKK